jgi:hypothetical protein
MDKIIIRNLKRPVNSAIIRNLKRPVKLAIIRSKKNRKGFSIKTHIFSITLVIHDILGC